MRVREQALTLIEVLIVMAIIGLLAVMTVPSLRFELDSFATSRVK